MSRREGRSPRRPRPWGGLFIFLLIAARNIGRNCRRTVLCVFAVATAVFFTIFMQGWISGMFGSIEEVVRTWESGHIMAVSTEADRDWEYYPVQYPLSGGRDAGSLVRSLEAIPEVRAALPRIVCYASLFDSTVKHAFLIGMEVDREASANHFNLTERDNGLTEGRYPLSGKNECAIGFALAQKAGLKIGDRFPMKTVSAQFSDKYWNPVVTGIFKFDFTLADRNFIVVPFDTLSRLLVLQGATQRIFIYLKDPEAAPRLLPAVRAILGKDCVVKSWQENYWIALFRKMDLLYIIIFAVFQILASFLIINTMVMVIYERIKEIGMMGALGMEKREIVLVFFLEAVLLSLLGSFLGAVAGGLTTFVLSFYPIDLELFTGGGMSEMPMSGTLFIGFSIADVVGGFLFGVAVSSLCTLIPSLKSAFIEPVEALRR